MNTSVLPPQQLHLWHQLQEIPRGFVLYGGTAIALQLGHRISEDFDFFTSQPFSPRLLSHLDLFHDAEIRSSQGNTLELSVPVGDAFVKMSFFGGLPLKRVREPLLATDNGISVASLPDMLGMKCKVVLDRAERKDYLDIVALLRQADLTLTDGLAAAGAIFGEDFVPLSSLKALSYTSDLAEALLENDQACLHEAVRSVVIDSLPVIEPQGEIGDHAPGTVPCAAHENLSEHPGR